jgi:hypothetical protein
VIFGPQGAGIVVLLATVGLAAAAPCFAAPASIEPFFGRYEGKTILEGDGATTSRDIAVSIQPDGDRFRVEWTTVTRLADGQDTRKTYSIGFEQTNRPEIFRSTMRTDLFGNQVPLDPLKGDPYVWSRVVGRIFTLYSLQIADDGSYDLQVYERTLDGTALRLRFERLRENEPRKVLEAVLDRVPTTGKAR